jgi:hypothetical protein
MSTSAPTQSKTPVAPHGIVFLLLVALALVFLIHFVGFRAMGTVKVG